ncbi:MAG: tetratricopeptide repeat protein [Cyanobacteria bacterium J06638_20]
MGNWIAAVWQWLTNIWQVALENPDATSILLALLQTVLPLLLPGGIWVLFRVFWRKPQPQSEPKLLSNEHFPFEVIAPRTQNPLKQLMGSNQAESDKLADFNIPYQRRLKDRSIRDEVEGRLQVNHWLLILGQTGLGKTREAAEVAQTLNNEGWAVIKLRNNDAPNLTVPRSLPPELTERLGDQPKLLFFFDNINQAMYLSQRLREKANDEKLPQLPPLQERLLEMLHFFEGSCGADRVWVIATARSEETSDQPNMPSEKEKLEFNAFPAFWQQFDHYPLSEPDNQAIVDLLEDTVPRAGIRAEEADYSRIADKNDQTFRNVVENLVTVENREQTLSYANFRGTLQGTWKDRYRKAIEKYPAARFIYDAVELLRAANVELYDFVVLPTARMLAGGNKVQQIWCYWRIHLALRYLIQTERILQPRDGQIEAKEDALALNEYIAKLARIVPRLVNRKRLFLLNSVERLGKIAVDSEAYQAAVNCFGRVTQFNPNSDLAWFYQGYSFVELKRYVEGVAAYDKALDIKSDYHEAWYNRGVALDDLGQKDAAIASYDKALEFKPDYYKAWYNRGVALSDLGQKDAAIASYDKVLEIKPDFHQAWSNRGVALSALGRYEAAIASYDKTLEIEPDYHEAWSNRGGALSALGQKEAAIASYDKALDIKSDFHEAWDNKGYTLTLLGRYQEALVSFDRALEIKSDHANAIYNKAVCYRFWNKLEEAFENLQHSIQVDSNYREMAKTDTDFDGIREDERFRRLVEGEEENNG